MLELEWSPEQIATYLRRAFPDRPGWHVCHETIYQALYRGTSGLSRELTRRLCTGRPLRKRRRANQRQAQFIAPVVLIEHRPEVVDHRGRVGDWERRPDHRPQQPLGDRHPGRSSQPLRQADPPAGRAQRRATLGDLGFGGMGRGSGRISARWAFGLGWTTGTLPCLDGGAGVARAVVRGPRSIRFLRGRSSADRGRALRAGPPSHGAGEEFLALGPIAEEFLTGAAASGDTNLTTEIGDILALRAAHGTGPLLAALERAVAFSRW